MMLGRFKKKSDPWGCPGGRSSKVLRCKTARPPTPNEQFALTSGGAEDLESLKKKPLSRNRAFKCPKCVRGAFSLFRMPALHALEPSNVNTPLRLVFFMDTAARPTPFALRGAPARSSWKQPEAAASSQKPLVPSTCATKLEF